MIYGHIDAPVREGAYPEAIERALRILKETDLEDLENGHYPADGGRMILQLQEYATARKESKKPEVHRRYIDVQYMVHGCEWIGSYPDRKNQTVFEDRLGNDDILFYEEKEGTGEVFLPMTDGSFAVFFPEDVHRPGCQMEKSETVRKVVLKVPVELLSKPDGEA